VNDLQNKVEKILEDKIRPILKQDGGDIRIEELKEDGTLVLAYTGRCSGCPGVEWTHTRLVEPAIMAALEGITRIEWTFEYGG